MGLQHTYRFLAPVYDKIVGTATFNMRNKSIKQISSLKNKKVLLSGIGTGLDVPLLDNNAEYFGIDITPGMLAKIPKNNLTNLDLCVGNVMQLPYNDNSFDIVIMHLILAVVPDPQQALLESTRVCKTNGSIIILDKFIRPGQKAYFRRLISPILGLLITRTNVVFENLLQSCPNLSLVSDEPTDFSSWFRRIECRKIN